MNRSAWIAPPPPHHGPSLSTRVAFELIVTPCWLLARLASSHRHKTRSELLSARRAEWRPPMSYDFDGDGYVDNLELFIGCRLDTNKDGRIDTAERKQAAVLLHEMQENYVFGLDVCDARVLHATRAAGTLLLVPESCSYTHTLVWCARTLLRQAAGPVMTSYIEHRVSDQPQWTDEALQKLVPPWAITPRRSLHLTARNVDPTRGGHGRPNRRFPVLSKEEQAKERTLGSGPNMLEAQAGTCGRRLVGTAPAAPVSNIWSPHVGAGRGSLVAQVKWAPASCSGNNWPGCSTT